MVRVAMLSFWHVHARDYARVANAHPDTEIVAAWDELPERGKAEAERLGVPFEADLQAVLARSDVDGVIVDAPTNIHRDVLVAAANAGKHIFTEKVVAPTLREFNEVQAAVDKAGIKLTVSLPRLNAGYTQAISELIKQGALGTLTLVRTRLSHNGGLPADNNPNGWLPAHFYNLEQCGGGAMIDLGCHPMYLARLFLGLPDHVSAQYGYVVGREVEDNAVVTLGYANGAAGVVEAGFVNPFSPFTIEIHGTEGSLLFGTPAETLLVRANSIKGDDGGWKTIELPKDKPDAFSQWVSHIQNGTTATENIQAALDLTRLMEAANLSAKSGKQVRVDSLQG